ncbi:DNA-binding protein [Saccharibacillus sp. O16]|nr:DNA-binding protein [Saccharibacillus sp. O16]
METGNALRSEIEKGILNLGLNFSGFSELSGINRGIFSAILNSNPPKPISLHQLESIGKALGQPEGWMFESYIDECFFDGKPNRRRVEPFLIRCAELGKKDCIEQVLSRLLDDLKQVSTIFEIGEALYLAGKVQESLPFYECVIQNDRYNHSEKLAISHYRVFRASICEDHEINLRAAIRFESYCEKLPDHHRLDGLMNLIDVYFSLDKWEEAERYARELRTFSEVVYQMELPKIDSPEYMPLPTEKPLVVYYGYAFLSMESIMSHHGFYKEALEYTLGYEDLNWFKGTDDLGKEQIKRFSRFSLQNRIYIDLFMGQQSALSHWQEFVRNCPEEILAATYHLLKAANQNNFHISEILDKYVDSLELYLKEDLRPRKKILRINYYVNIHYEKALYYFRKNEYDSAIVSILLALGVVVKIKNKDMFMKLVPLFEVLRSYASKEQEQQYVILMKKELNLI